MKGKKILIGALVLSLLFLCISVLAQVNRPYRNGSVWSIAFIKVKPGMQEAYMNYLTGQWKSTQEASKKEKLILSYKVLTTEAHDSDDWNMLLLTEYKDLATMFCVPRPTAGECATRFTFVGRERGCRMSAD